MPSGPTVISGSSAFSGTNTVPLLLTVWSTPWSKNWPKNVNSELYGGDRPTSVVTFGMNSVLCAACSRPEGRPSRRAWSAPWCTGTRPGRGRALRANREPGRRDGRRVAPTSGRRSGSRSRAAACRRRCCRPASARRSCSRCPDRQVRRSPGGRPSAARNFGVVSRGNGWSAAANFSRPGTRSLHEPSTVRRPYGRQAVRDLVGAGTDQCLAVLGVGRVDRGSSPRNRPEWRSAILICLRMNDRSPAVTTKPLPTGSVAAAAAGAVWSIAAPVGQHRRPRAREDADKRQRPGSGQMAEETTAPGQAAAVRGTTMHLCFLFEADTGTQGA